VLPRIPPTPPEQALSTFEIKPGFRLELVASEPLVVDPIALSFDENGCLYVVEMRDYSERRDERLGRIRRLVDRDGDGRFDASTVYVDGLPWPTGVICYGGGVFVAAAPDLLFCRDTNDDGVADLKQVVFTGFASDYAPYQTNKLNVQALLNSLTWGLDNRIHGAASFSGGHVRSFKHPVSGEVDLRGHDFSFDPRTLALRAETGGGQYGLSFDNAGRKFICSNSDHIQAVMHDNRYAGRNSFFNLPNPRASIAVDGPAAEVYRISPEEPWRVLRTKWRVGGLVPGPIEGGGRASGYFTSATGITVYRGNAWPEEFSGDVFIADCGSNLLHRKKVMSEGVGLKAERPADEQKTEFLRSRDIWFRPVQMANGPDGALYIADLYREVIEHPWSLPQSIKQHLDLNSGNDRGRIYRILPEGFRQPKPPRLGAAGAQELVATLAHPNGWHRDTAARLLFERQDQAAVSSLGRLLRESPSPLGRLHSLYALAGLESLTHEHLLQALADSDPRVRRHAIRLAETVEVQSQPQSDLARKVISLARDPDPLVRYQLAFTLSGFPAAAKVPALAAVLRLDHEDPWVRAASLNSLATGAGEMFTTLASDSTVCQTPGGQTFLRELVRVMAAQNQPQELGRLIRLLQEAQRPALRLSLANAFAEGLALAGSSLAKVDPEGLLGPLFKQADTLARKPTAAEEERVLAIQFLSAAPFDRAGELLLALLDAEGAPAVQLAAINAVARFDEPRVAAALLKHWPVFTPRLREATLNALLQRPTRIAALFQAIEAEALRPTDLSPAQRDFLRRRPDTGLRTRAIQLLGASAAGHRQAVVDRYRPALELSGDAGRGRRTFAERCAACHRLAGLGSTLGPDLVSARTGGKEKLLTSILDPNREVAPNYLSYVVETKHGDSLMGLIVSESPTSVSLRRAYGEETTVSRADIARIDSQGLSAMPEELEAGLTVQDLADLLEFVTTAEAAR
jgi:putative membrane-bound dehydrogenase-like protein